MTTRRKPQRYAPKRIDTYAAMCAGFNVAGFILKLVDGQIVIDGDNVTEAARRYVKLQRRG